MGKAIETRKLIKWGSSKTLIMSLPRTWTKKYNLSEEDEVQVTENPDGSLLVFPLHLGGESQLKEASIKSDQYPDKQTLYYVVQTKFLDGNDIIRITSKEPFSDTRYREITGIVSDLLGFEIMNKTPSEIMIKDIMALKESSVEELVRLVSNTVLELLKNFVEAVAPLNISMLEAILSSRDNIQKYYLRVHRQLRKALMDPSLLIKMGIHAQDAVDYAFFIVALNDISVNIATMSSAVIKYQSQQFIERTSELLKPVYENFKEAISSFLFRKTKEALMVLSKIEDMKRQKREIENEIDKITATQPSTDSQIILDNCEKIVELIHSMALSALRRAI